MNAAQLEENDLFPSREHSTISHMRTISRKTLREFWDQHPEARQALQAWSDDARRARWLDPADLGNACRTAGFLAGNRVLFSVKGNVCRLVVAVHYPLGVLRILYAGEPKDHDQVDAPTGSGEATMEIKPIKNETHYRAVLAEIDRLFDALPDTPEANRLEVLTTLVESYEEKQFSIPGPDPIEAILYHMEKRCLSRRDIEPFIGSRARVSEVLNRRRPLTIEMIRNLHKGLGIPAEVLIQPYDTIKDTA
jgi:HTH-type transcriptional regulator/antitoxin HigA